MSQRYKGAIISATPPTTSTSSASGEWTLAQQMQAQGASAWPVANPDPYFNQVSLLLHGDGTNGGQNNTFLDSSPPGGYSVFFDNSNDYITTPTSTNFAIGTGDFTVEFWVYLYSITGYQTDFSYGTYGNGILIRQNSANTEIYIVNNLVYSSALFASANTWYHFAATRSSGTLRVFVNGVQSGASVSNASDITPSSYNYIMLAGSIHTGGSENLNGFLSNVRYVVGSAVYTSNFTPPYSSLTAITGTQLLTCQGPNIVDNSPNAFPITVNGGATVASPVTITRAGNTTQGTFTPFSQAAGYWSNYFDGTGDYLTTSGADSFDPGSGNWTIEGWCYFNNAGNNDVLINGRSSEGSSFNRIYIIWLGTTFYLGDNAQNTIIVSNQKPLNQWFHVAVVKNSSTYTAYINGTSIGSSTTALLSRTIIQFQIGARLAFSDYTNGYISNVRVVKGTAVYTSNFTPSTTPLTAISGTSLLTCQSNRFVDNSANNFTITPAGDTKVTAWSPFIPALTPYSTSTNGGSGYFDGNGDYLSAPSIGAVSGDFTIEFWAYKSANGALGYDGVCSAQIGTTVKWYLELSSSGGFWMVNKAGGNTACRNDTTTGINDNAWHHWAVCRSGSTWYMFKDGISLTLTTNTIGTASLEAGTSFLVGAEIDGGGVYAFNGTISNFRAVNGTALYTANFTPPTSPLTSVTNTSLLLNCTNAAIYDNAIKNDVETVGNAQISTSVKKYGTGSMYFDGNGDYLTLPPAQPLDLSIGDWTVEAWVNLNTVSSVQYLFDINTNTSGFGQVAVATDGSGSFYALCSTNGSGWISTTTGGSVTTNSWNHFAFVRYGTSFKLYINGVSVISYTSSSDLKSLSATDKTIIGGFISGYTLNGYIDDLRITKGVARYTADFVPPIQAFPDY